MTVRGNHLGKGQIMTAVQQTQQKSNREAAAPGLVGLSHLGITVSDVAAAQSFWTHVMGFGTLIDGDELCMVFDPSSRLAIGLTSQQGEAFGPFEERRV